jgi:hypothetical protein
MTGNEKAVNFLLASMGALVGGAMGFFLFVWLVHQNFYAMIVPGATMGLGAALLLKERSLAFGAALGILALFLGVFAEWWTMPFVADDSLGYFLTHLHQLKPITFIMIVLGGVFAVWIGQGRDRNVKHQQP